MLLKAQDSSLDETKEHYVTNVIEINEHVP